MSHASAKQAYQNLSQRLNRLPQGAPPSDTLYKILGVLFSENEAQLVAQLPLRPFTADKAAAIWGLTATEARTILDRLAGRAILLDSEHEGTRRYVLPPPMAGFFEFALMRVRGDIDQKHLAELLHQYLNVEEEFITALFLGGETRLGRVFVQEPVLTSDLAVHVLDYERASDYVRHAQHIGVSMCYCRHKAEHRGVACQAPMNICLTFNATADSLIRHQYARRVDYHEGLELLDEAYRHNLVQCGENARHNVSFICNCCGCCCEALLAAKKFGSLIPVHTTNYIPHVGDNCNGCARCVKMCPVNVISIEQLENGSNHVATAKIADDLCLGCGVCVRHCARGALRLNSRPSRVITPVNSVHRIVAMAIERGRLADLIFDNSAFASHRAMAAVLSAVLKMPPLQRAMASHQFKSIYLERLIDRFGPK